MDLLKNRMGQYVLNKSIRTFSLTTEKMIVKIKQSKTKPWNFDINQKVPAPTPRFLCTAGLECYQLRFCEGRRKLSVWVTYRSRIQQVAARITKMLVHFNNIKQNYSHWKFILFIFVSRKPFEQLLCHKCLYLLLFI